MGEKPWVTNIKIKVEGAELPKATQQAVLEVVVDQHAYLPGMFTIRLHDADLTLIDSGALNLTKKVEISMPTEDMATVILMQGEITALEPVFGESMIAELVVRGYDLSHRLFRESKSKAYLNKKDSDLAQQIAGAATLTPAVDATATVYDHIYQHNQSDLAFLMQRAWRIGYECFVEKGTLYFRAPPSGGDGVELTWGKDLLSFRPRMTLAEQVNEVVVKGWDVEKQAPIIGRAQKGRLYPTIEEGKDGAAWATKFGAGKAVIVDQPVVSQAEANILAAARLDELSGAFVDAEGVAFRRPEIKAGRMIKLKELGTRFSGTYLVTAANHVYNAGGLTTTFTVRGSRSGLLADQVAHTRPLDRWPGVVIAVVTNTDDPKDWGRVKVKFPWMADDAESDWARVVGAGGGPEAGLFVVPEVGDEVVVAFAHGDFSQPFVLGGLWNGKHKLPAEALAAASGEKPLVRTWHSRKGHHLATYDNADNKVEIVTAGGHQCTLDDAKGKITLKSKGGLSVTLDDRAGKISVEGKEIEIQAGGNLKVQAGGNLDLSAKGQVNVKGAMINLN